MKHPEGPDAGDVFDDYLQRCESGDAVEFEALCRAHPELAAELRRHESQHRLVERLLPEPLDRDAARVVLGAGPASELDGNVGSAQELLERLRQGPARDRYQVLGEIARGGMGVVLRVRDLDLRRKLAMKVVHGRHADGSGADAGHAGAGDPRMLVRFLEEAQITSQLDHPGIVPVHELGVGADGRPFMTMRLVRGETLRDIFDRVAGGDPEWTQARAVGVLQKVCEAMAYAHDRRVIHRDLKPANIMVGRFGEVYVMDWGLARLLDRDDPHDLRFAGDSGSASAITTDRNEDAGTADSPLMTRDGQVLGTPAYMSPEQAKSQLDRIGPPTDVYAVGAMLYHLITGQMPYVPSGSNPTGKAVRWRVMEGPPRPLREFGRCAPPALIAICERAMAREPADRYPDMRALERDLRAFVEHRVVAAYEAGSWAETRMWLRRNRGLAAALLAATVAVVVGIGLLVAWKLSAAERVKDERLLQARVEIDRLHEFGNDFASTAHGTDRRPVVEEWLERAQALVDELPEFGLELADLRGKAVPSPEAERRARDAYRRAAELRVKRDELLWRDRVLDPKLWPTQAEIDVAVAQFRTVEPRAWNEYVFARVRPDDEPRIYGEEQVAVRLAQSLVDATAGRDTYHPRYRDTLAFALFRVGEFDAAVAEQQKALGEPLPAWEPDPGVWRADLSKNLRILEQEREDVATGKWQRLRNTIAAEVAEMETEIRDLAVRRDRAEQAMRIDRLAEVVRDLTALRARLELAKSAAEHPGWPAAIAAIARHPGYRGLVITRQLDLVPLGPDPDSGLWEFAHLPTGEAPERDPQHKLQLGNDTGLVFVLLPPGRVPVVDGREPDARHARELEAFFLSKYELTRSQWRGLDGRWYGPCWVRRDDLGYPANCTVAEAIAAMDRASGWLRIPLGVEWEYGCRANTTTAFWPGDESERLAKAGNFQGNPKPVGSLRANAFGLHDTLGNVSELCELPRRPFDRGAASGFFFLGGSFGITPSEQRYDATGVGEGSLLDGNLGWGLRPARSLQR